MEVHSVEYGPAGAHKRSCIGRRDCIGDMEEEASFPDSVRGKPALVCISVRVHGPFWAEYFISTEALVTMPTRVMQVSPASAVAPGYGVKSLLCRLDEGAYCLKVVTSGPTSCTTPTPSWLRTISELL